MVIRNGDNHRWLRPVGSDSVAAPSRGPLAVSFPAWSPTMRSQGNLAYCESEQRRLGVRIAVGSWPVPAEAEKISPDRA